MIELGHAQLLHLDRGAREAHFGEGPHELTKTLLGVNHLKDEPERASLLYYVFRLNSDVLPILLSRGQGLRIGIVVKMLFKIRMSYIRPGQLILPEFNTLLTNSICSVPALALKSASALIPKRTNSFVVTKSLRRRL